LINREMLCAILEDDFEVIEAENGLVGLQKLEEHYEDLSLVLLDVMMPVCDGLEFLRRKGQDHRFDSVPVIVTTASVGRDDEIKCLELGANDFVAKPYDVDIMMNRINNTVHLRESASIVNQLMWDELTKLYSKEFFYRRVDSIFTEYPNQEFDMVCSDIENFKALNDRYGRQNCDVLLHDLADRLTTFLPDLLAGGRVGGDTFAFLIRHQADHEWVGALENVTKGLLSTTLNVKYGVVENVDHTLASSLTCDRAIMAMEMVKGSFGTDVAWYDDDLRKQQLAEHALVESMEEALEQHQFAIYYQPKHNLKTNSTGAAEALVRWIHPKLGFIPPADFIPLFERNGFIAKLDLYICEEVCREIKRLQVLGLPVVPISFNASRLDFDDPDFVANVTRLADSSGIDHALLHVEVTETAYSENPENVIAALKQLRENGFSIELDDFGSGYSSLSSLNVLPLDVMKLDMSIIRQAAELNDYRIVHSAIQMAQFLGLTTVAEGVETQDVVDALKEVGCDLIQGYYYSKPLTQKEFEAYLAR
ncbi:MAG: EAL domain-containing protein, partial [Atopobiaceae bacterium]|nr:EAL domain-containing protein [Atopobiaceae bacterium]